MIWTGNAHLFKDVDFDPQKFEDLMEKPPARTNYVIYFTPRSGSSWLTDLLVQTKRMSLANEAFNPNFIPNIARAVNASNMDQYVNALKRKHNNHGIYGFEITWHQLNAVFQKNDDFIDYFGTSPAIWLIRRDIVSQAVSLAKMVTTNVAHAPHTTAQDRVEADLAFAYDEALIKRWLLHILAAERGSEQLFSDFAMSPLRICYEDMMSTGAENVVQALMQYVGAKPRPDAVIKSAHEKLATAQNADYSNRFRQDCAKFLQEIDQERQGWLDKLTALSAIHQH